MMGENTKVNFPGWKNGKKWYLRWALQYTGFQTLGEVRKVFPEGESEHLKPAKGTEMVWFHYGIEYEVKELDVVGRWLIAL